MTTATAAAGDNRKKPITAREAEAYVPPLLMFTGNYKLKGRLLGRLKRPVENDSNLLVVGAPGTGKTGMIIAYLREQFHNPTFFNEDVATMRAEAQRTGNTVMTIDDIREWQSSKQYYFQQINGATDSEVRLRNKLENLTDGMIQIWQGNFATHKICFVDELGELFFRGFDEALRPVLTESGITTYATAQNFHSKRKADTFQEEDERLTALLRRFADREETELPTAPDHIKFLAFLMREWDLKLDSTKTIQLLVDKSEGIVGLSKRVLIRAIDEPDRRLTYRLVDEADVNPL